MTGVSVTVVMQDDDGEVVSTVVSDEASPDSTILFAGVTCESTIFPEVVGTLDRIILLEEAGGKFEVCEEGRPRM